MRIRLLLHFFVSSFLILFAIDSWGQGAKLFQYLPETTLKSAAMERSLTSTAKLSHLADSRLVKIDISALDEEWIVVTLPSGIDLSFRGSKRNEQSKGDFGWFGMGPNSVDHILITAHAGQIGGRITTRGGMFDIRPADADVSVFSRVLTERIPHDKNDAIIPPKRLEPASSPQSKSDLSADMASAINAAPTITILLAFTTRGAALVHDAAGNWSTGISRR